MALKRMKSASPLVSVVVPTYNGARFLDSTLRSLGAQSYENLEVIVVDDGSTDETLSVARSSDLPAMIVEQRNLGVAVARNRGLSRANGQWVGFIDQDDLWRRDRIRDLVAHATAHDLRAVASTEHPFALAADREALRAVGDGRDTWPRDWIDEGAEAELFDTASPTRGAVDRIDVDLLMQGAAMLTTSVLYDRETALAAGGFAPHARALDDHLLNLNLVRIAGPIERIDTRDLLYRVHPASTTTVSPMAGPMLSALASVRLGGMFQAMRRTGANVEHLLHGLPSTALSVTDQLGLLLLTVPPGERAAWSVRWMQSTVRRALRRGRHR